jgi:hypothetical protein
VSGHLQVEARASLAAKKAAREAVLAMIPVEEKAEEKAAKEAARVMSQAEEKVGTGASQDIAAALNLVLGIAAVQKNGRTANVLANRRRRAGAAVHGRNQNQKISREDRALDPVLDPVPAPNRVLISVTKTKRMKCPGVNWFKIVNRIVRFQFHDYLSIIVH